MWQREGIIKRRKEGRTEGGRKEGPMEGRVGERKEDQESRPVSSEEVECGRRKES